MVQISHPYMTTGKTIALTIWTFVGKVMSLLLNMLSRLVIAFLPRSKHLLISWLQSPFTVTLEPKKIRSATNRCFPSISHEVMGPDAMILVFWVLSFKTYPRVSKSLWQRFWLAVAWCRVGGTERSSACMGPLNEVAIIFTTSTIVWKVKVKSLSRVRVFAIPWTVVYQASLSMGFSRQEYWSGLPFPSPGDLPDPGI